MDVAIDRNKFPVTASNQSICSPAALSRCLRLLDAKTIHRIRLYMNSYSIMSCICHMSSRNEKIYIRTVPIGTVANFYQFLDSSPPPSANFFERYMGLAPTLPSKSMNIHIERCVVSLVM